MNNSKSHMKNYFLLPQSVASHLSLAFAKVGLTLNFVEGFDSNKRELYRDYGKMVSTNERRSVSSQLNTDRPKWQRLAGFILACAVLASGSAFGARISDIRGTKHNLSAAAAGTPTSSGGSVPTRTVQATTEKQVCVFCHTPHGATLGVGPLWNRKLSSATYAPYTSSSLDANAIQGTLDQPGGSSKLCLSCHDGTLAIGSVNVLNGLGSEAQQQAITMTGTAASGVMASGSGTATGYTRNLGIDLTNDHPISVNYTTALSDRDGELRSVDANQNYPAVTGTIIGLGRPGFRPKALLEPTGASNVGQIQCSACHDPHLRETNAAVGNQKFLILNRFQEVNPTTAYNSMNDIGCVACHDKNQGNAGTWVYSAHANPQVATQTYTDTAANQREFPTVAGDGAATNLPVWKASCLNCHDTHTTQGSRWLLREGAAAGASAIEETCYQCHSNNANTAITPLTNMLDIKSDFALLRHQPITLADQGNVASEAHDIGGNFPSGGAPYEWVDCSTTTNKCGADFVERRSKLGAGTGNLTKRHAECTDCHNPHRVVKFNSFLGNAGSLSGTPDATGTHKHTDATGYTHTNIASGALRGTFGVEPVYTSASFANLPFSYNVKRGDPGISTSALVTNTYVTREYQVCLKCHSDYGYPDNNVSEASGTPTRPPLGGTGLTPQGIDGGKGMYYYTNQAKEFQAPFAHRGEGINMGTDGGAGALYNTNNHRSWHPVMDDNPSIAGGTGRTGILRSGNGTDISARWKLPWSNAVGTQTMYCDDCHGSNVTSATSVIPDFGKSWGPHGSGNDFILKGAWNSSTGNGSQATGGCFKCHDYNSYALGVAAAAAAGGGRTGFWMTGPGGNADGHQLHVDRISATNGGKGTRCNWCHVAVPHGWKNKALLVNLNDIGPEAGQVAGTQVRNNTTAAYNAAPYYLNAVLKVINFKPSGKWQASDCGSKGAPGNGQSGKTWMSATFGAPPTNNENCATPP